MTELEVLRNAIGRLRAGTGGVVVVDGEPGIGKSSLLTAAAAVGQESGCTVLRGTAEQDIYPLPLRLLFDSLEITERSPDPRRAGIVKFVQERWPEVFLDDAAPAAVSEMLLTLVDELCAGAPTMMVLDDVQWADGASLDVCRRLAATAAHLPLLLVLSCRPVPHRSDAGRLLAALRGRDTISISLGPLDPDAVHDLVAEIVGAPPCPGLVELVAQAMGNPLYVRELVESLVRENMLTIGTCAELRRTSTSTVSKSLAAALDSRLNFVPAGGLEMLRMAALLGGEFAVTEVAVLLGRSTLDIAGDLQEAMAAGILVEAGKHMRFRHPLIRQALYDGMPTALRVALHRDAARALDGIGVEPQRLAQHLLAAGQTGDRWTRRWIVGAAPVLAVRAPQIAAELLRRELDHQVADARDLAALSEALAQILLGMGEHEQAATRARQALAVLTEPADRGRMHWLLARALFSGGHNDAAVTALEQALRHADLPDPWRARLLASLAMFQRAGSGALDAADATAREALEIGEATGDTFATAYALTDLWINHSVRRHHLSALECVDRALETLSDTSEHADLRAYALHGRIFTLQNLDRWSDAEAALHSARRFLLDTARSDDTTSSVTAAVLMFWLGRWDDALAELSSVDQSDPAMTYRGLREHSPGSLWHGVAALIAARRDDHATARVHVTAGLRRPAVTVADRENTDFLRIAQAVTAEQDGDKHLALSHLADLLDRRPGEMTLIHQWSPAMVRLALAVDDRPAAAAALAACRAEAASEQVPARAAAAADWCRGLYERDPEPLRSAVEHYRATGVPVDLAGALEDLAAVLAERDDPAGCRRAVDEAITLYGGFGAVWDIRRAQARLRRYGIRRGVQGTRPKRPAHGWDALTPTEHKVALLVASGRSTPEIAQSMFLTRRTAQTHISRILAKLGLRSRVEIARVALDREPDTVI
ncbi:helix-turn-helix transcriptional regulator [Nonomuraea sp. CA-141351]|uniref:helix-turn-helix transcriptional regulator n=1 Tax=Nonomuraea sp. CA-141351 TaxID=3239996 RepID=UPI003D90FCF5